MPLFDRPPIDAISVSNTLFSSGTFRITGGANITVSSDASGALLSVTNPGILAGSASDALFTSGTFRVTGGPGITVGSDASGASVSGQAFSLVASNSTFTSGSFRVTGGSGVTVRSDASGAVIDANETLGAWRNFEQPDAVMVTHVSAISKVPLYFGEQIPGNIKIASIGLKFSAVTASTVGSLDVHFGVYTRVNSTSLALLGSASNNFNLSTASSVSWSGINNYVLTSPGTLAAISSLSGGDYVFGVMFSATATPAMNFSIFGAGGSAALASSPIGRILPGANQQSTATSQGLIALQGRGSTTVNALPANVVASEIVNQGSGASAPLRPWMYLRS